MPSEARDEFTRQIRLWYGEFVGAVAANRNVSRETVVTQFGKGLMVPARDALRVKMVDRLAPVDVVLQELFSKQRQEATRMQTLRAEHEARKRESADLFRSPLASLDMLRLRQEAAKRKTRELLEN